MQEPTRYYIASKLENADKVRELKSVLDAAGWQHTYDWTVHGSVQREGTARIAEVASQESQGVFTARIVIVLLAGGRGTHTELGIAIGQSMMWSYWRDGDALAPCMAADGPRRICIVSEDPDADFGSNGTCCAFYHHPFIERFTSVADLLVALGVAQ